MGRPERVALVTGGGSGIGRAIVLLLAARGHRVVAVGRRPEPLEETRSLADDPAKVLAVAADVASDDGRARALDETLARFRRVDILVNNAASSGGGPVLEQGLEQWRRVFATNVEAPFALSQRVAATMRGGGWGRIVNVASVYGHLAMRDELYRSPGEPQDLDDGPVRHSAYQASKGAIHTMTRDLAVAFVRWGITVNSVSPGMVRTRAIERRFAPDILARLARATPAGRLGAPEDVAHAVGYLTSDDAGFVTATDLVVDGGWTAW